MQRSKKYVILARRGFRIAVPLCRWSLASALAIAPVLLGSVPVLAVEARQNAANLDASRDRLERLADVLEQASDALNIWTAANRVHLQVMAPVYLKSGMLEELQTLAGLGAGVKELGGFYDTAGQMTKLAAALRSDLSDQHPFVPLSSRTVEEAGKLWVAFLLNSEHVAAAARAGLISPILVQRLAIFNIHLNEGAGDIALGVKNLLAHQGTQADAAATALDGVNKIAWAALGYTVSGGNEVIAKAFIVIGDKLVERGREWSAGWFRDRVNEKTGTDGTLIAIWDGAQRSALARGNKPVSFDEFYHFDPTILGQISEQRRRSANAVFGLRAPPPPPTPVPVEVFTRREYAHYSEVCRAGFCVRTDLTNVGLAKPVPDPLPLKTVPAATNAAAQPAGAERGVRIDPRPQQKGAQSDSDADGILALPKPGARR